MIVGLLRLPISSDLWVFFGIGKATVRFHQEFCKLNGCTSLKFIQSIIIVSPQPIQGTTLQGAKSLQFLSEISNKYILWPCFGSTPPWVDPLTHLTTALGGFFRWPPVVLPNDLSGTVALVARGKCSHYHKARAAQESSKGKLEGGWWVSGVAHCIFR